MFERDRGARALAIAIALALLPLAARTTAALWRFAVRAPELPLWDEAKYGLDGARLAAALHDLDLLRYARLVYDLDVWPPLFPIAESAVFVVAGSQIPVARGLIALLFFALVFAAWWAGHEIAPSSPAVGGIAALLVASSPFVQLFATQVMLELPGALLYLVCLGAYARFLRTGARRPLLATGLASAALFFTKYNYGLLWLVPLFVNEAWIACDGPRGIIDRARSSLRCIEWRRPFTVFVALYVALLAAVAVTGGGTLRLGSAELSVRSIGNPLYVLVLVLVARAFLRPRRAWTRWRHWERGLEERHRVLLATIAAPAALWLLLPPHLRGFVEFVDNRSTGPPLWSLESVLFHPRAFVESYHAASVVGAAALAAALAALARLRRAEPAQRVLLLCTAVVLAATALHPYKEARFFFIAAFVVWLAASWNVVTLTEGALARARIPRLATSAALAAIALAAAASASPTSPALPSAFAGYTVPASTSAVLDRLVELAAARPTLVLGTWNQLSPALVEWRFMVRHDRGDRGERRSATGPVVPQRGNEAREEVPERPELIVPSRRGGAAEAILRRLRGGEAPEQVALLALGSGVVPSSPWSAAYAEETYWLEPVRRSLANGETSYALRADEDFPESGYRLVVFAARGADPR